MRRCLPDIPVATPVCTAAVALPRNIIINNTIMWNQLAYMSCSLLLVSAASANTKNEILDEEYLARIEKILLGNIDNDLNNYMMCDHESGENARCVKKSLCTLQAPPVDRTTLFTYRELIEGGCTYLQICCPESKINQAPSPPPVIKKPVGCGYSNPGANVLREVASDYGYADFGDFPWMVALLKKPVSNAKFHDSNFGGGTLIHPSVVLTVAHKVDEMSASDLTCRAGEWDTKTNQEVYQHQDRDAKKIVIHEQFSKARAIYDFALIILEKPFDLDGAPHIGVACLEKTLPPPGTECYSMGWGEDFKMGEKKYADILKKVRLPLVDGNKCQNQYRNSKLGATYNLHKTLTCAGGVPSVDTCVGDGGSSLVCPIPDKENIRYSVVGMVVYGLDCGTNLPGVYAKIPEVYDWVQIQMVFEGFTNMAFYKQN